jgi:hypothetical protein
MVHKEATKMAGAYAETVREKLDASVFEAALADETQSA